MPIPEHLTVWGIAGRLGVSEDRARDLILHGLVQDKLAVKSRNTLSELRQARNLSDELQAANAAYKALYGGASVQQPKRGHIQMIAAWLQNHHPGLSKEAIKRIAMIVNPNKKGGSPRQK